MRLLLPLLLLSTLAHAATPFLPEVEDRFSKAEIEQKARVVYDVTGNSSLGTSTTGGTHGMGVFLPAKAIITRSFLQIATPFSQNVAGDLEFKCEDAANIMPRVNPTGFSANQIYSGLEAGGTSSIVGNIAAPCEITATVRGAHIASGKAVLFVNYVVGE